MDSFNLNAPPAAAWFPLPITGGQSNTPSQAQAHWGRVAADATHLSATFSNLRIYAVLDCGQAHDILALAKMGYGSATESLFKGTPEEALDEFSPRLLQLNEAPWSTSSVQAQIAAIGSTLCELSLRWPCISWIFSEEDIQPLAQHLRGLLNGLLLDDQENLVGEVLVRHYDPRVLPGFLEMLTPDQYAQAMHPIAKWSVWTRHRQWSSWSRPTETRKYSALLGGTNRYTIHQHALLNQATVVDRVAALLEEQYWPLRESDTLASVISTSFLAHGPNERFLQLTPILKRAAKYGLDEDGDLLLFASIALGINAQFDEYPLVRECLESRLEQQASFKESIAQLPEHIWVELDRRGNLASLAPN